MRRLVMFVGPSRLAAAEAVRPPGLETAEVQDDIPEHAGGEARSGPPGTAAQPIAAVRDEAIPRGKKS